MLRSRSCLFTSALVTLQFLLGQPNGVVGDTSYPAAQPCFDSATATAKCDNSSTAKFNACTCSNNGNWLDLSAKCIGATDKSELTAIYNSLASNCAGSNTPIVYSLDRWLAVAGGSGSTTRSTSGTTTVSAAGITKVSTSVHTSAVVSTTTLAPSSRQSTPVVSILSSTPGQTTASASVVTLGIAQTTDSSSMAASESARRSGSKLNTQSIIGIAVGVPCLLALVGLLLFLIVRGRKQENRHSRGSDIVYNPNDSSHDEGVLVAAKRPQSTVTVLSDAVSQPSYQQGRYYTTQQLGPRPLSDTHTNSNQQQASLPQRV